jgi:hypothetical protein
MSEPHTIGEPLNPLEMYRKLQMAEGRVAELEKSLWECEDAIGCLYPLVLMLCDNETSRPTMEISRKVIDHTQGVGMRAKLIAQGRKP